ncbi:HsdR family type I site-specific deoxyribonuclease [Streptomyces sp. SID5614]|uniref:type I restriction endonuclease subunit R n=1 Tax=Streptomyces sp. SID5614 TaxID=2690306 RepID=UPI00136A7037|nr:HsdR family type I site-specific deoxyribonuclease [Streptomyces sp. SID5614]MZG04209.1 HsdR family type I site-specific deoxyribonuclease [Streptomyces sp. SID5614]
MAKGVREREFQNHMVEWSLPLGWAYAPGRSLAREKSETVVASDLRDALVRLNPDVIDTFDVESVLEEITNVVTTVDGGLVQANERVLKLLRGRQEFRNQDGDRHALRLIDLHSPTENILVVADEVTIMVPGQRTRRFDLVYYVNGLPLVVVEVKSPTADSDWRTAAAEINNVYATEYPWFFTPNVFCIATDGVKLKYGAALAPTDKWNFFRDTGDDETIAGMADVQRSVELLMSPSNVLDLLENFCLFATAGDGPDIKYLPRYPQKEAAHLIHQRVLDGGKRGLVWHHQGSGKTLLMVFAASLLLADTRAESPTVVLVSDRTQLVRQTSESFVRAMGDTFFHQPSSSAQLRDLLARDVRGVISTTVHKFKDAGAGLTTRDNVIVMIDEAHRTQSAKTGSLAGQMRAALQNAKFFGMTGTPVRNLNTDTFALFSEPEDPDGVLHRYTATRSIKDEATVPVMLEPRPVGFDMDDDELQAQFDAFADANNLDDTDREALSRKFGRLTSVFANPERIEAICQNIVDHYLSTAYLNGMKAQVVTYNRDMAVAYTNKINEILAGFEAKQKLTDCGRHPEITAEVNISVSDGKDEDPRFKPYLMAEHVEENQRRRFLSPENPLCFLVVTEKLMTGFDAPNEGVLYLDKPLKAHTLFQTITRPNRAWDAPSGFVKTQGVVVDYIGLAEEVQKAVQDPTPDNGDGKGGGFVTDMTLLVREFRAVAGDVEDLLAGVQGLDLDSHDYAAVRLVSEFLDQNSDAADTFRGSYRLLARLYPYISTDPRVKKYKDTFGLFGSVYVTLFKQSTDDERKERLAALGPMVLDIINANVYNFEVVASQEEALVLDSQGLAILKELMRLVAPTHEDGDSNEAPSAKEILDRIKEALDLGVDEHSVKYTALAERIKRLRERIIQNASDALDFLAEALKIARSVVSAAKTPNKPLVTDDDHVGILSRIIAEHAPKGLSVTERRLAEEIDQVVTSTLANPWDNADARSRGVRRATAAVYRRFSLKPVGDPYDATIEYVEAHYLVD